MAQDACNQVDNPFDQRQTEEHIMTTTITICNTCKRENWEAGAEGITDGEALAALVEAEIKAAGGNVQSRRFSCLMGCDQACNVTIQGKDKLNYTLGGFSATKEAASGILEYANLHANSKSGQVPYRDWPQAIKGHFTTRHPPLADSK